MTRPARTARSAARSSPPAARLDVVVVGAGVAGLSTALWLRDFGLDALLIEESSRPGGQLHEIHAAIPNYLATFGWDGARLAGAALSDARAAGLTILVGARVARVSTSGRWVERAADDAGGPVRVPARALVLATGLRRRTLGVPGETEFVGRGVSHSANREREQYAGKPVVIVGLTAGLPGDVMGLVIAFVYLTIMLDLRGWHDRAQRASHRPWLRGLLGQVGAARRSRDIGHVRVWCIPEANASGLFGLLTDRCSQICCDFDE